MSDADCRYLLHRTSCIGQLLLYGGFIDAPQLKAALAAQQRQHRSLGDLLEGGCAISATEKQAVLHLQRHLRSQPLRFNPNGSLPHAVQLSLGQLLLENGEISPRQLDEALAEHRRERQKLGRVLVRQQVLTPAKLLGWLRLQKKLLAAAATATALLGLATTAGAADADPAAAWKPLTYNGKVAGNAPMNDPAWGQRSPRGLTGLNTVRGSFGELLRSRDGSMVLQFTDNGLEFTKHF